MKYFVGGSARAYLYSGNDVILEADTLINSSIEITTDSAEARGGEGNKLLGKYYHTSNLSITFEDQNFSLDYIQHNVGAIKNLGANDYVNEQIVLGAGGAGVVSGTPAKFLAASTDIVGWVNTLENPDVIDTVVFNGKNFVYPSGIEGQTVCIRYPQHSLTAEYIDIPVNIIPDITHCVLVAKLYKSSGNGIDESSSALAGKIIIDIPRLQFSGAQTINMTSTGVSSTPLTGNALASSNVTDCEGQGIYATITVVESEGNWYDGLEAIAVDDAELDNMAVGDTKKLIVYGVKKGYAPFRINEGLIYESAQPSIATVVNGLVSAIAVGETTIKITVEDKPEIVCNIAVEVVE